MNLLLRSAADISVLNRPPWWTWNKTLTLMGVLLAVAFGALLWVYLLRRRMERQQAAQFAFSRQVLERVEEERRSIAANLHDSLGQVLLAVKNHALVAMQMKPNEPGVQDRLKEISGTTSQAIDEVRHIIHGLRPYQLDRLGLTQAIRTSVDSGSENGTIVFATRVENIDGLFDKESEIHVYRIVQEAVNNVLKHTEATVVIKERDGVVMLSVRDNGKGCDAAIMTSEISGAGYGLRGMAERVRILGGTMTIDSQPGHGTSLNFDVPIKKKQL
jgi:signal transduction histidine kinase